MKSSIYKKFLTLLLGSVTAASVLISFAGILTSQRAVSRDSQHIMSLICEKNAEKINGTFRAIEQSVQTAYSFIEHRLSEETPDGRNKEYMQELSRKIRPVLKNTAENTDSAVGVYLRFSPEFSGSGTAGMFLVNVNGDYVDHYITDLTAYPEDDIPHVGWYYEPVKNGTPTWLSPYYNENLGVKLISYVIPIIYDSSIIGVVGMDINSSLLTDFVEKISLYDTGYAMLACGNGDIVYHREYPDGIATENFDENLKNVGKAMRSAGTENEIISYNWHSAEKRLTYSRLVNGMYLITTAPASEIDSERNSLIMHCILLMIAVLIISAVLGIRLVEKITRPLRDLTESAEKIADGQWDTEITKTSDDEVGVLADTLHSTMDELHKYIQYVNGIAYTDEITGLGNNRLFTERITGTEKAISDKTAAFSLAALDITNLRHISDTYGSGKSESVIITIAEIMKKIFPGNGIYRISDEMFIIYLDKTGKEDADRLVDSFSAEVDEFSRSSSICPEELVVAAGTACFEPSHDTCFADVTTRAGKELYRDKKQLAGRQGMYEDALKMLQMVFHKILKVNLTTDEYYEIKVYDDERCPEKGYCDKFGDWMRGFAETGQIAAENRTEFLQFIDTENLRRKFASGENHLSLCYRRRVENEFRWVMQEIVSSVEYSDNEQIVLIFVRDINDQYSAKLEYHAKLERISNTDSLTGLYNRHYFTSCFADPSNLRNVGIVFCDLNGLKYTNDHMGHHEGDKLLNSMSDTMKACFPNDLCFRTGGDEFIVCVSGKTEQDFNEAFEKFRTAVRAGERPIASIGKCWQEKTDNIDKMLTVAENAMYEDKKEFYRQFPQFRR